MRPLCGLQNNFDIQDLPGATLVLILIVVSFLRHRVKLEEGNVK
jgi:hypothetical protein